MTDTAPIVAFCPSLQWVHGRITVVMTTSAAGRFATPSRFNGSTVGGYSTCAGPPFCRHKICSFRSRIEAASHICSYGGRSEPWSKGGLDLGSTADLTALALLFGHEPPFTVLPFFWVPLETAEARERRDRVPYPLWIRQGFIFGTPGNTTDYDKVRSDVNELGSRYLIEDLAVDRLFQGAQLCSQLMSDGWNVTAFGQGFLTMAAPARRFLELVAAGELWHGGNPVLRWQASNASTEQDGAGNLKWSKKKSTEKIDGIVATTMALGRAMVDPGVSVYESRGVMTVGEPESKKAEPVAPSTVAPVAVHAGPNEPDPPNAWKQAEDRAWQRFWNDDDDD